MIQSRASCTLYLLTVDGNIKVTVEQARRSRKAKVARAAKSESHPNALSIFIIERNEFSDKCGAVCTISILTGLIRSWLCLRRGNVTDPLVVENSIPVYHLCPRISGTDPTHHCSVLVLPHYTNLSDTRSSRGCSARRPKRPVAVCQCSGKSQQLIPPGAGNRCSLRRGGGRPCRPC